MRGVRRSLPRWLSLVLPVTASLLCVSFIVLWAYSPLNFARNFTTPKLVIATSPGGDYTAAPIGNQIGIVFHAPDQSLTYQRLSSFGKPVSGQESLSSGRTGSQAQLVLVGKLQYAIWVAPVGQYNTRLLGRFAGDSGSRTSVLVPGGGIVEHPTAVAISGGRIDVVYSRSTTGDFAIYLTQFSLRTGRVVLERRLINPVGYGFFPRVALDGSGHLDLLYMDLCCNETDWDINFARFTEDGRVVARARRLAFVPELATSKAGETPVTPGSWAMSVTSDAAGSVWAAWQSSDALYVERWSPTGVRQLHATYVPAPMDSLFPAAQIIPTGKGVSAFVEGDYGLDTAVVSMRLSRDGTVEQVERCEYATGTSVTGPVAFPLKGRPEVLWRQTESDASTSDLMLSVYRQAVPLPILAHLGFNVGNTWLDLWLVLGGALFGAFIVCVVNPLVIIPLTIAWYPVARVVRAPFRWTAFAGLLFVVLSCSFALDTVLHDIIMLVPRFREPYCWIIVTAAVATGYWVGKRALSNEDDIFRAGGTVVAAVYFVGFMYVLTYMQGTIGQI